MQDIVTRVDRVKEIVRSARGTDGPGPTDEDVVEIAEIAIDLVGELVANSRRIAAALEAVAKNTAVQIVVDNSVA